MSSHKRIEQKERRRYIRLDHILPVAVQLVKEDGQPSGAWRQAFTQDISGGGLCLVLNHITPEEECLLKTGSPQLSLHLELPSQSEGVRALVRVAWIKKLKGEPFNQYVMGVSYERIPLIDKRRLVSYVVVRRFVRSFALFAVLVLSAGLVLAGFYNIQLRLEREALLQDLGDNIKTRKKLAENRDQLNLRTGELNFLLSQSKRKIEDLQARLQEASRKDPKAALVLQRSLDVLESERKDIKERIVSLARQEGSVEQAVIEKTQEASLLEGRILSKMTRWLLDHQNKKTGLVLSFEGDRDLKDWAFTYDQALAAIVFIQRGHLEEAKRILDFYYRAERIDEGGITNAYYASSGSPAEYIAHAGPNIWLGLALLRYARKASDPVYLNRAKDIALWLETIKDKEGGLRGGKIFSWYSTEHNLDAYAFYKMLFESTGEDVYRQRARQTLAWLNENAYTKIAEPLVNRGKGDATIATDTYAWSISAIGPKVLKEQGMDPDGIIDFALSNCAVSVEYERPDGVTRRVRGFDFAKHEHLARGGIVSCEWTAQMILALKDMSVYHYGLNDRSKSLYYQGLSDVYAAELSKMIITSLSPVGQGQFCLPYASDAFADTGHGWRTPKGNRTGSVAATAYAVLAIEGVNPLRLRP